MSSSASHRDNFADRSSVGEVAENCKDDNAGEDRGERVAEANDECVPVENLHCGIGIVISGLLKFLQPVTIVGEVIVAWEGQLTAIPDQNIQIKKKYMNDKDYEGE